MHLAHFFAFMNNALFGNQNFKEGDKYAVRGMTVEILAVDSKGLPRELSFIFDVPLEDQNLCWLKFNWNTFSYSRFQVPTIGQTVSIPGPSYVSPRNALRFVFKGGLKQ